MLKKNWLKFFSSRSCRGGGKWNVESDLAGSPIVSRTLRRLEKLFFPLTELAAHLLHHQAVSSNHTFLRRSHFHSYYSQVKITLHRWEWFLSPPLLFLKEENTLFILSKLLSPKAYTHTCAHTHSWSIHIEYFSSFKRNSGPTRFRAAWN